MQTAMRPGMAANLLRRVTPQPSVASSTFPTLGKWLRGVGPCSVKRSVVSSAVEVGASGSTSSFEGPLPNDAVTTVKRPISTLLDSWTSPGVTIYANPICSQMDQLLLKCEETEDVLALLVTHRGVFFVHNLVTSIQVLAAISQAQQDVLSLNQLLRDPRYDVLIRDLLRFVPKLDFLAMANIACSLQQLDHKHYMLLSRMLRPLQKQPVPDTATMIRCAEAYTWAGYHAQVDFYSYFATALSERAESLDPREMVQALTVIGESHQYQGNFFSAAEAAILNRRLLEDEFSPKEVADVATAFAAHLRTTHDDLFARVAAVLENVAGDMEVADISRCFRAFRRVALRFDGAIKAGLLASVGVLREAWLLRRPVDNLRTAHVATLLECAAYYGIKTELTQFALDYLDDRVDEVSEQSAIHVVYAMCLNGGTMTHSNLLLYLFRKIGAATAWEQHKVRVFQLWFSHRLQFPWLDCRMKKRCVVEGLRTWILERRGYGCPYPDEVKEVAAELEAMGIPQRVFVPVPDTPYEVDIAIGSRKDALLVVSEVARNTFDPVGGTLLQMHHLKARGWRCHVIPRRVWRNMSSGREGNRRKYLESLLTGFAD